MTTEQNTPEFDLNTDPEFIRTFAEWLLETNDTLPPPESFFEWLERNEDALA